MNDYDNEDISKIRSWIRSSLIPFFVPCAACALKLRRRYYRNKKLIVSCVNWSNLRIEWTNNLPPTLANLTNKDLIKIGATASSPHFMVVISESGLNGAQLISVINNQERLPTKHHFIFMHEIENVIFTMGKLGINYDAITTAFEDSEFINNEMEPGKNPMGGIISAAAGQAFGKYGKSYGYLGADCGGKKAECAEVGKEKGGRKKGGKNIFNGLSVKLN